jgi:hypothetical protein
VLDFVELGFVGRGVTLVVDKLAVKTFDSFVVWVPVTVTRLLVSCCVDEKLMVESVVWVATTVKSIFVEIAEEALLSFFWQAVQRPNINKQIAKQLINFFMYKPSINMR